jgi:hypothetical protein
VVEFDPGLRHRARDLRFEVLARHDDDHARDVARRQDRMRETRREARFPGSRRGDDQRIVATLLRPRVERIALPRTQREPPGC